MDHEQGHPKSDGIKIEIHLSEANLIKLISIGIALLIGAEKNNSSSEIVPFKMIFLAEKSSKK